MPRITLPCSLAAAAAMFLLAPPARAQIDGIAFVEAESLAEHGGWKLDTQFIHTMGSPYLMAHGLGSPVEDARGTVKLPSPGDYRVWVRAKNWVGPWDAPGAPGRFQVAIDGKPLAKAFGETGKDWRWEDGGVVKVGAEAKIALHDLTGFNGRCDAVVFAKDTAFTPPASGEALAQFRHKALGLPEKPPETEVYDLVVVGGGYSGLGAAISGARQGLKVALIQNRPVLGGNGSSEIRVWAQGGTMRGKYPRLGEIIEEFADRAKDSPGTYEEFGDAKKEEIVRAEKNIDLFLNTHAWDAQMAADGARIASVDAIDTRTGVERRFRGKFFVDCTGHGTLGAMAGASHRVTETGHLGMSNMWAWEESGSKQAWPETPWALPLEKGDFPETKKSRGPGAPFYKGEWFWESGFDKHPIDDLELVRDWNLRAVFGAFTAMKRGADAAKHQGAQLTWVAYIGGTRESRLLDGDIILTEYDIISGKDFPDGCVPTTWDLDLHYPKEQYAKKFPDNPFISRAVFGKGVDRQNGYPVPYRCFYSKNIDNLFMAGRCISVTHEALGTVRVMRTCGMMGEVVGKAAYLCVKNGCDPRGVYQDHLAQLIDLMEQPGAARRDSLDGDLYVPEDAAKPTPYGPPVPKIGIDPKKLAGIVVDDGAAKLRGSWGKGNGLDGYVGTQYLYHAPNNDAEARFEFAVKVGDYEDPPHLPAPKTARPKRASPSKASGENGFYRQPARKGTAGEQQQIARDVPL
ncbi:MAG: FAD-dependent oxidoreductase [Verrucomicrobiales bacterium]